jgi:CRP/FNR family cyclic AMP-dependent transcriptional regulator
VRTEPSRAGSPLVASEAKQLLEGRVILSLAEGQDVTLALLGPGDFFGELSLLDGVPRSAGTIAVNVTETLVVKRDQFVQWLQPQPCWP